MVLEARCHKRPDTVGELYAKYLMYSLNLLQSRGGSLRLPLFQNGACPFPSTPLLSVLMLVTHTVRERVPCGLKYPTLSDLVVDSCPSMLRTAQPLIAC